MLHKTQDEERVLKRRGDGDGRAAGDLACLMVSLPGLDEEELLGAYGRPDVRALLPAARTLAAAGLARRTSGEPHIRR